MCKYFLRLDDASDYMDLDKWRRMEILLDKYGIKPIFGIIPKNADESIISKYDRNEDFWSLVHCWIQKGWIPAMHGYEHRYVTSDGGINPINKRSEFAGLLYDVQADKIRKGYQILVDNDIRPEIFFAPSHTFDENTLMAIKNETPIRVISDTIAWDIYKKGDFYFVPQQSGSVRKLPFKTVTFCYHPNTMNDELYEGLERFLAKECNRFSSTIIVKERNASFVDSLIRKLYFQRRGKNAK